MSERLTARSRWWLMQARLRLGFRITAVVMWVTAGVLVVRLLWLIWIGVVSDVPPRFDEVLPQLAIGWSLLVGALLLAAAGALLLSAAKRPPDRPVAIPLGLVFVLVALVGAIWTARRPESFPTLDEPDPAIPGYLAWAGRAESESPPCIWVMAAAGGEARTAYCSEALRGVDFGPGGEGGSGWTAEGGLVFPAASAADLVLVVVDPDTGVQVDAVPAWRTDWSSPRVREDGAKLVVGQWWLGAQVVVEQPGRADVRAVAIRGPHDYRIEEAQWSPDGQWILLRDSKDRVMVTPGDHDAPRVLRAGGNVGKLAWFIEGDPTYTFVKPTLPSDEELCQGYRYDSLPCGFDYTAYSGDLSDREVRALLLVLDEEYLTAAILATPPEPIQSSAIASIEVAVGQLEALAAEHDVTLRLNPWAEAYALPEYDEAAACQVGIYEIFAEGHVIESVGRTVDAMDLKQAFARIEADLASRVEALRACAAAPSEMVGEF